VFLSGLATVIERFWGLGPGINQFLLRGLSQTGGSSHPLGMGLATGFDFLLLGSALLYLAVEKPADPPLEKSLALVAALVSLPVLGGLGDAAPRLFHGFTLDRSIAIPTTLGLAILILAIFFARPDRGLMASLTSNGVTGYMLRRLLPAAIVLPIGLDWLTLAGQRAGFYSFDAGLGMYATSIICTLGAAGYWSTARMNKIERERDRALESLQLSEEKHRVLYESSPIPMWVSDGATLQFLAVNPAAIHSYGYSPQEFQAMTTRDLLSPGDRRRLPEDDFLATAVLSGGGHWRHQRKDGVQIDVEIFSQPILWGNIPARLSQILDITDRKQAEELLRQREERFRQMADNIQEIFWTLDATTLQVLYVSPAYEQICGRTRESLYADPYSYRGVIHPDDRRAVLQHLEEAVVTGRLKEEFRIIRPDGTVRWVCSNGFVVREKGAGPRIMVGTTQDITDQKAAQMALRKSEADHSALIQCAPYGIYRAALDGTFLMANSALVNMLGYDSEAELLGVNLESQIYQDREERGRLIRLIGNASRFEGLVAHWRRKDGKSILIRSSGRTIRDEHGNIRCFETFIEDITRQKSLEDQLRQAQKMEAIGQLAGGIAHDFNNLLTVILGQSEKLLQQSDPTDSRNPRLREIRDAADRARWVTAQLLVYGRRQSLETRVVNLNILLQDLHQLFDRLIGEDVLLVTDLDPALGHADADGHLIQQAIMNLVVNARDAMPRGGTLKIRTENLELKELDVARHAGMTPGSYVTVSVSDSGIGMDATTQAHIFEPFFTTKGPNQGTGLGLAMVQSIVSQSGGDVSVQSELGAGSTFTIYLPRVEAALEAPAAEPKESSVPRGSEAVLLVEDAKSVRVLTREFLASSGYTVLEAADGHEALELAQSHHGPIHLLLTDVVMPGMSGPELATKLRTLRPEMKVLLVSGHAGEAVIRHGVKESGAVLLPKPFTEGILLHSIRAVLDDAALV
jgi:PAS domain S-box-containing protein